MQSKKNIILCVGAVLSALPFVGYFADLIRSVILLQNPFTGYDLFGMIVNTVFIAAVVILAVLQIRSNCKGSGKRAIPIMGSVVSGVYLLVEVLLVLAEYPSYIVMDYLNLFTIQSFIAIFVSNFLIFCVVGHILLLIGHIKSISVGK